MAVPSPFANAECYTPTGTVVYRGTTLPARFGDAAAEYEAARDRVAVFDRSDRGLLMVTGTDRKNWLHGLVTNAVKTLADNAGSYAFAIDVRGRILFDLSILSLPDTLWLDLDASAVAAARTHLERYLISEDVRIVDATHEVARLGCSGPGAAEIAHRLEVAEFPDLAALSVVPLDDAHLVRHDFAGLPGFELMVSRAHAPAWWQRMVRDLGATPAGQDTLDTLRIEAGIPWLGRDLTDTTLPPETGQAERGVDYRKGCYLGQEIIERMRSRGALARRLVRLHADGDLGMALPTPLRQGGAEIGRVTSLVRHPLRNAWVGLGYVKTSVTDTTGITAGQPPRAIRVEAS